MHILLPLANSITPQKYKLGDYILKEGEVPKGLYLIYQGQCKVGGEKLGMRSKTPSKYAKI
jgi:CRP-like cAMP-binding protein